MKNYAEIKKILQERTGKPRYFTRDFYALFLKDYADILKRTIGGERSNGYENVKKSDFYNRESSIYCEFLEIFYDSLPHFRLDWYADSEGFCHIRRLYASYPDVETARKIAASYMADFSAKSYEVMAVV